MNCKHIDLFKNLSSIPLTEAPKKHLLNTIELNDI